VSERTEGYRQRAAEYAKAALAARREHGEMFRDLATAWRGLADRQEALEADLVRRGPREAP
jgi:hypothetical protein